MLKSVWVARISALFVILAPLGAGGAWAQDAHLRHFVSGGSRFLDHEAFAELGRVFEGVTRSGATDSAATAVDSLRIALGFAERLYRGLTVKLNAVSLFASRTDPAANREAANATARAILTAFRNAARSSPGLERHDTQRLVSRINGKPTYTDDVLMIYAHPNAKDGSKHFQPRQYRVVAMVVASAPYRPLRLDFSTSEPSVIKTFCVHAERDRDGKWRAWVAGVANSQYCVDITDTTGLMPLDVYTSPKVAKFKKHLPQAARWEWSRTRDLNTIGVKCGDEWCQLYRRDLGVDSDALESVSAFESDETDNALGNLTGWQDYQPLGEKEDGDTLTPTGPTARIAPYRMKHGYDKLKDKSTFVPMAQVIMETQPAKDGKYAALGFSAGTNTIRVCRSKNPDGKCKEELDRQGVPLAVQPKECLGGDGQYWFALVQSGLGEWHARCMAFVKDDHADNSKRFAVRWAFDPNDEGLWVRCPGGCCQLH